MPPRKRKLRAVTSGIGFDEIDIATPSYGLQQPKASTVTSHTARVYLAGAGFLADAVRCAQF